MVLIVWSIIILFKELYSSIYDINYFQRKFECDLKDKVRWIAIEFFKDGSSHTLVRDHLFEYIEREQRNLCVENNYRIDFSNEKELDMVYEILETHKQNVIHSFVCNSLKKSKEIYKLNNIEHYMFILMKYLHKNKYNDKFNNNIMHEFLQEDDIYRTHKLTDFGVIYHKLYYISTLFCMNNEKTKVLVTDSQFMLDGIKGNIENGEIKFWSHRL